MGLNTVLITQARLGSTRLPQKVLLEIEGKSLLQMHLQRLQKCINVNKIVVATTENLEDEIIYKKVVNWGFEAYKGSEFDVLDRYYKAAKLNSADWVVRVTEHVTPFIRKNSTFNGIDKFTSVNFQCNGNFNNIRMTVDEQIDIYTIEILIKNLGYNATWEDYSNFIVNNPKKFDNQNIIRNEGYFKSLKKD